jgi:prefoldin subunit 5
MMNEIDKRLDELKKEFDEGQKMLAELDARREQVKQTLLRISGAIQVLEELQEQQACGQSESPVQE